MSRIKGNIKKNSQYYRRRNFIRKLINNPFKYYMFEKLKNYPHVYSKHYDIKPRKTVTKTSVGAVPLNVGGPSGTTTSTINITSTPKSPSGANFTPFKEKMSPIFTPVRTYASDFATTIGNLFSSSKKSQNINDDDLAETQKLPKHRKGREVTPREGLLSPMSTRQQVKVKKLDLQP